jgi:hypothetical protein
MNNVNTRMFKIEYINILQNESLVGEDSSFAQQVEYYQKHFLSRIAFFS